MSDLNYVLINNYYEALHALKRARNSLKRRQFLCFIKITEYFCKVNLFIGKNIINIKVNVANLETYLDLQNEKKVR